jgi:hypothetical protein
VGGLAERILTPPEAKAKPDGQTNERQKGGGVQ